ncbi:MAG: trans-2-enoyl-CoA reductase family protein [candidate division Zixibacteria bacterium]|nr:trans-2-enoyl-CoA reductase family protein [candidate division Zixibacteria bacterium]
MHISPRIRGFICTTAHPVGCARNVKLQLETALARREALDKRYRVLVIGASNGYGLAARIAALGLYGADTVGVFYDRPPETDKTATPGFYNTAAFHEHALRMGAVSVNLNGDAFVPEIKEAAIAAIRERMGQVDAVVYSLAAPRRTDPVTGEVFKSAIKPVGETYIGKTIDLNKEVITEVTMEPATEEDIRGTVGVMGGDDLRLWVDALETAGVLAQGVRVNPFSYIGPTLTWPMYRSGTVGKAKEHLEETTKALDARLRATHDGMAHVSVNKAVITQASSAIPVVPLYISLLYRIMRERGIHEDPIHQMIRLFTTHTGPGRTPALDAEGRIRLDDRELAPEIQKEILHIWNGVTTDNFRDLSDYDAFKRGFRQLFGFEVDGINYEVPVEIDARIE